jgi:hypothetical protein
MILHSFFLSVLPEGIDIKALFFLQLALNVKAGSTLAASLAVTGFAGFFGQIHEFVPLLASVTSFDSFMIVDMVLLKTVYYVYY